MTFNVLTIFPEMLRLATGFSMLKRAADSGIIRVNPVDIRDFATNKHGQVDDAPYGGGAGMVMMPGPVYDAFKSLGVPEGSPVIYLTPTGHVFNQKIAKEMSKHNEITLICGHYEGVDERVLEEIATCEISIGDYVLTGGELAALVVIDAVGRLLPGVLGKEESHMNESFSEGLGGLLEHPHYTRPYEFMGRKVPDVLLSGHHGEIRKWRKEMAVGKTTARRPDLLF